MIAPINRRLKHYRLNRASKTARALAAWWPGSSPGGQFSYDKTGRGNRGTWSGTGEHWAADAERQGMVPMFNGTDDYVGWLAAANPMAGLAELSVSFWLRVFGSGGAYDRVFSNGNQDDLELAMDRSGGANDGKFSLFTRNGSIIWRTIGGTDYSGGAVDWTHVVLAVKTGEQKLYINGQFATPGLSDPWDSSWIDGVLRFASRYSGSDWLRCDMDDIRIYTRALSPAEIAHIYHAGRVAPLSDLVEPVGWEVGGVVSNSVVPWHLFGRVA
jgi:hypothetical protein